MARTARKHSDSGVYHVILRGVNKQQIFECTEDYQRFLNILRTLTVREQDESRHRSKYGRIGHLHIPSCKGQQVQKMRKDSSREWYVNLPLKTKTGIPTAHLMNSSPTRSINIFKTERIRYLSPDPSRPSHRPSQPRSRRYTKSSHYHLPHAYLRRASALAHWYLTCNQGGSSKV